MENELPFILSCTSCLALSGHTHFDKHQPPAGYGQVPKAAAAMPPPGAPSWASESHQAGPPPAGPPPPAQAAGSTPQEMASMAAAFSVQQQPPPASSATPSLSSCSTVSTVMSRWGCHCLFPVFIQADAECENTGGGRLEGARSCSRSMPSLSSLVSSFVALPSTFPPFFHFLSSFFFISFCSPAAPATTTAQWTAT